MLPAMHRAIVSFVQKEDAVNAMKALDQTEYRGKVLAIKLTSTKTEVHFFIRHFGTLANYLVGETRSEATRAYFSPYCRAREIYCYSSH